MRSFIGKTLKHSLKIQTDLCRRIFGFQKIGIKQIWI
jgi:hypothetical protein